ncbi:MAG: MBOAT family protein [Synergistaceae bacterium]|nr:MBOAT family protein [Synergistaceae bacterium]
MIASLVFYAFQSVQCLPILIASIAVNYAAGVYIINLRAAGREKLSRSVMILGLVFNVLLLGVFKYADFIIETINQFGAALPLLHVILPPGISFFTITEMIYLVDAYQGVTKDKNLVNYSVFVSFFPHILAGPILWHKPIVRQLNDPETHRVNWENIARGLTLFILGMSKKVLIADQLSHYVGDCFSLPESLTVIDGLAAALFYTVQLYFDFSGYSDMAVGLGWMMNIDLPVNFNSPYKAYGMIDYWNRWHMSLTHAITNYIYTPILMLFKEITFGKAMFATFAAMVIAGVWHGAGWTFVIFGALHGLGLVLNHVWKKYKLWMPRPLGYVLMWGLILTANVFFRAESVSDAVKVLYAITGGNGLMWPQKIADLFMRLGVALPVWTASIPNKKLLLVAVGLIFFAPNAVALVKSKFTKPNVYWLAYAVFLFMMAFSELREPAEFVYFRF